MDTLPLLSIVIASRNRVPYAISAIQSILEIPDPRLELVVQDNSDSRELESWVHENVKDVRFRYQYTPPPFSSIANFNAAVALASGEYVCLIGDDDGVNPEIMEAAAWAKTNNVDSLAVKPITNYLWPDPGAQSTLGGRAVDGCLAISGYRAMFAYADTETEMRKLLRNGGLYYLDFQLPKIYHGLVHRRCLEAVHQRTGAYFGGLSPDVFSSLSIGCVAERVVVTDYPLTIAGACRESSSVIEGGRRHSKKLEDAPHFRDRGEYHWCELVPRVYTVETIWVDSGVAGLRAMGRADLVRQLNLPKLAAYCIGADRGVMRPVWNGLLRGLRLTGRARGAGVIAFAGSLVTGPGGRFARRVWNRLLMSVGIRKSYRIVGLMNMVDTSHALVRCLRENGQSFAGCASRLAPIQSATPKEPSNP